MTIDEAIKHAKEQTDIFGGNHGEFLVNVAEWLEELKVYKDSERLCKRGFEGGYRKAIDDFKRIICEELKLYIDHEDYMCVGLSLHKFTRDLAEQLKEGSADNE